VEAFVTVRRQLQVSNVQVVGREVDALQIEPALSASRSTMCGDSEHAPGA
jgi:hypothetical protein